MERTSIPSAAPSTSGNREGGNTPHNPQRIAKLAELSDQLNMLNGALLDSMYGVKPLSVQDKQRVAMTIELIKEERRGILFN